MDKGQYRRDETNEICRIDQDGGYLRQTPTVGH
jgi:hypothetical protein